MRGSTRTLRALALLGAASAAVHQLRYAIGYGAGAQHALAAHPHGYLAEALPGVLTALLIAIGAALMRAVGARPSAHRPARRPRFVALWIACAVALAAIYGTQETLEGAGAIAGSGWIGLALSLPAGFLVALAMRGADAAEALRTLRLLLRFAGAPLARTSVAYDSAFTRIRAQRLRARGPPLPLVN